MPTTVAPVNRPEAGEYAAFYANYVALVPEHNVVSVLESQATEVDVLLRSIPESQATVLHSPYTWTIKQVVGHVIDGERVFAYRAMRFARNDPTELPGFNENHYAAAGEFNRQTLAQLAAEFAAVRQSTLLLLRHIPDDAWTRGGVASGAHVTVLALAFIMAGHVRHHLTILRKRVGIEATLQPGHVHRLGGP